MFSQETIDEIETVARESGIEAAALLAVCEIESGGKAFVMVGGKKEPLIRFEGHYFDRLLPASKRAEARAAGLAAAKWGVVKNPRSQAGRWKMLLRAMRIDRTAAIQSISWGLGQVMGSHWKALGYASPDALVAEARSSVAGQVRLMVRFLRMNKLEPLLAARNWAEFARRYNGPSYKKNFYDTRMASAYARHKNRSLKNTVAHAPILVPTGILLAKGARNNIAAVRDMQQLLTAAGYAVKIDGDFGTLTDQALRRFQAQAGLTVDGVYGRQTREALQKSAPQFGSASAFWKLFWRIARVLTFGKIRGKF
ncbi:MAG: N-acetylmuramidase domain-containing protein [Ahrensia sp.]|nr:N-acetylmuramidase domain-containing protein [Ahrensia sp.]